MWRNYAGRVFTTQTLPNRNGLKTPDDYTYAGQEIPRCRCAAAFPSLLISM
jgi:hypothetical protein